MNEFKNIGGAKIGMFKSTRPLATLTVTPTKMELSVTVIGKFVFLPEDVTSITLHPGGHKMLPGIQIHHNVPHYKEKVIYWSGTGQGELIRKIEATGFITNTTTLGTQALAEVRALQANGGFALRKSVTIALGALWLLLVIAGCTAMALTQNLATIFYGIAAASGMVILFSILVLASPGFATTVLKPGYNVADINKSLYFLMVILGFGLIMCGSSVFMLA
jgi:hypothetical protein